MSRPRETAGFAAILAALLLAGSPAWAAATDEPSWTPKASERLVRLPATYLRKTLDHDFAESELGQAMRRSEEEIGLKSRTLGDLQAAIEQADSEVRTELRHQFLVEKRLFLEQVAQRNELRRRHLETQERLFDALLGRMKRENAGTSTAQRELIERQNNARERFDSALADVDLKIFGSSAAPESKYTQRYAENMAAIEQLVARIQSHPMSESGQTDRQSMTKQDHVRQMLAEAQAGMAILDQEDSVLGYMAKLIALDALALSEEALDVELTDSDVPPVSGAAEAIGYFMTN